MYLSDGFSDWEAGFILPELKKNGWQVETIGDAMDPRTSMGGFKVLPDRTVKDLPGLEADLLMLPGGISWNDPTQNQDITEVLPSYRNRGTPIAAICGATLALARVGILDKVRHTSNALPLLQAMVPTYGGEELYHSGLAVSDDGVITASGIGAMEFAHEILKTLGVYDSKKSREWLDFFRNGVFPAWMAS
ncbi:MAG: type 1 glutamine amidotransferase family protein [Planctomycetota bacterium]